MKVLIRYFRIKYSQTKFANWSEEEYEKLIDALKKFLINISTEASETKEASIILRKYVREGKVTPEEELAFKAQLIDVLKAMGIGIPFVLIPGASLLLPLVAKLSKKFKINIFPSSFNRKIETIDITKEQTMEEEFHIGHISAETVKCYCGAGYNPKYHISGCPSCGLIYEK